MGRCTFCGEPAGFFRSAHPACKEKNDREVAEQVQATALRAADQDALRDRVAALLASEAPLTDVEFALASGLESGLLSMQDRESALVDAWTRAADKYMDDGLLTEVEEARLAAAQERFLLDQRKLDREGALTRVGKASVLQRLLTKGELPDIDAPAGFPLNLQKNERLVWLFNDVRYLEDRVRREFVGRSQGVSVRVVSGVYARLGAFKGKPVYSTDRVEVGKGLLVITTKHLYFSSPAHSMRIPFRKIVSFDQFSDAIGLMRDAASAKPQFFVTGDGWFTYNLITNVAQLE